MSTLTWIPVAELLPDADTSVLVWTKGGEWFAAWHDESEPDDAFWREAGTANPMLGNDEPTHWAEPPAPGEDGGLPK